MNKREVNQLLALMKANYSYAFKSMSDEEKYMILNTWTFALQDIDSNVVMLAAMQLISASKWMPTVAELRAKCRQLGLEAADARLNIFFGEWPEGKRAAISAIVRSTRNLSADSELSLSGMLNDPRLADMAAGQNGFELLGQADESLDELAERRRISE